MGGQNLISTLAHIAIALSLASTARAGGTLPAGTPVKVVLMKRLASGAGAGSEVPLLVAEDVTAPDGTVLIYKGTLAVAKVVNSKGLGSLSPPGTHARLNIAFDRTWAVDGQPVPLCCDPKKPKTPYEFTRDNTGKPDPIPGLDELWTDALTKGVLTEATDEMGESESPKWTKDAKKRDAFVKATQAMNLTNAAKAMGADRFANLYSVLRRLQTGSIAKIATGQVVSALTAQAALEMARLADGVQTRLARPLKRRNIVAHVGTPVVAHVAEAVTVK
jgi:hypothetical protein